MDHYPAVVLGMGPAGLSGAIYLARNGFPPLLVGRRPALDSYTIENYLGVPGPVKGRVIVDAGVAQCKAFGVELLDGLALGYRRVGSVHWLRLADREISCDGIIVAVGTSRPADPGIPRLAALEGRGVSHCAICDAYTCKGSDVVVLGSGQYACEESLVLAPLARTVTMITHGAPLDLTPTGAEALEKAGVRIVHAKVTSVVGHRAVEGVTLDSGEQLECEALFVAVTPPGASDLALKMGLRKTRAGVIEVDPGDLSTSVEGIYAAGDCASEVRQVVTAAGMGAVAGISLSKKLGGRSK